MKELTLGSLFDGSGGFPLAAVMNSINPIWASEIEPFPIRVTTKRLPFMKHYGDIRKISGAEIEPVDIITFGSPCTDLSVAGKRAGLGGSNSSLFYEAIRIIKEMRCKTNDSFPRFIVFENVPGIFSSGKGLDFKIVLEGIAKIKNEAVSVSLPEKSKWLPAGEILGENFSLAWRVLNAKFWGVPQRRSRVYLVADFRNESAGKILFESGGLPGNSKESQSSGENNTRNFKNSFGKTIAFEPGSTSRLGGHFWEETTGTLRADMGDNQVTIIENHPSDSRVKISENKFIQTLTGRMGTGGGNVPLVISEPKKECYCISGSLVGRKDKNGPNGKGFIAEKSYTLNTTDRHSVFYSSSFGGYGKDEFGTITHSGGCLGGGSESFVTENKSIRRLTPLECCRLQGFPDYWCFDLGTDNPSGQDLEFWKNVFSEYGKPKTDKQIIKWLKKPRSDSAEYKMWGNGVALPCVLFVMGGIKKHYKNTS